MLRTENLHPDAKQNFVNPLDQRDGNVPSWVDVGGKDILGGIPNGENRYFDLPAYRRNGLIPGWGEVVAKFKLGKFSPRDFHLFRGYYRGNRRLAEVRTKKGKRVLKALFKNPDFLKLEDKEPTLLSDIASFIRGPSEKKSPR